MKVRILKIMSICTIIVIMMTTLTGCIKVKVSEKWQEKIITAYEEGDPYTYEQLLKKFGKPTSDAVADEKKSSGNETGLVLWVNKYDTIAETEEAIKNDKKVETLTVTFNKGYAVTALFSATN